ncbi:MAG: hypothetical protein ACRDD1_15590 [Planctomycetia bacterium]
MDANDERIVQLLTEIRDAQREEAAYRRKAVDESLALTRRAVRLQRLGLFVYMLVVLAAAVLIAYLVSMFASRLGGPPEHPPPAFDPDALTIKIEVKNAMPFERTGGTRPGWV